jgi:hypothetical protein
MKSDYPVSFIKDAGPSNGLTAGSTDAVATSIARLKEENEALRRLAALLTSQLGSRGDRLQRKVSSRHDDA